MDPNFYVWDARSYNTIGPYHQENAEVLVKELNLLDYQRSGVGQVLFGLRVGKIVGPFYVKSEAERNRLRSRCMTKGICK